MSIADERSLLSIVILSAVIATAGQAQPSRLSPARDRPVELALVSTLRRAASATSGAIALRITPEPGWHTYWRYAGDVGSAPTVKWTLSDGVTISPLRWPTPELISSPPLASYGYERVVHLPATVTFPTTLRPGSRLRLAARIAWVACKVECIAGDADLALSLPVGERAEVDSVTVRAIAADEARMATPAPGWRFSAVVDSGEIALFADVPASERRSSDSTDVAFFVDTAAVLDHAAAQRVNATATGFVARLRRSEYSSNPPTRITGLLVVGQADGTRRAIEVVAPVLTGTAAARLIASISSATPWSWRELTISALLGLLGGTLLTLMPCVLPVLSIKAFGLMESAASDASAAKRHATLFAAGVLASMWILVAVLLAIRSAGVDAGWGYQLQSPTLIGLLALVVFAAGLNMAGMFHLPGVGGALAFAPQSRDAEAFVGGVLVTTLATPCSAPFLASAVAYGITQGWAAALVVFTAMGIGLAWPVAIVGFSPAIRNRLPRPGAWMVTLQRLLAFPLFATAVWLAWVVARQAGADAVGTLLAAFTVLAFGLWTYGRFGAPTATSRSRWIAHGVVAGAAAIALLLVTSRSTSTSTSTAALPTTTSRWIAYHPDTLRSLTAGGRTVLLDFTADWCLTCKVNERVAFGASSVQAVIRAHDVVLMRADWTTRDARVTRALAGFGRNSVPLVVLYGPGQPTAAMLPTLLTPSIVERAITAAARRESVAASH